VKLDNGLKLYGTQLLVHVNDINIRRKSTYFHENTDTLVAASQETGLEVNGDKTRYIVMPQDQNAGKCHNIKIGNSSFERVEESNHLGNTLTKQNSIQEGIKIRLKSRNVCYHSVQNLLFSSLLSNTVKIKIHRTIIFPVVLRRIF